MSAASALSHAVRRIRAAHATLRASESAPAFTGGVVAAGLGLGGFAMLVLFLWVVSPFPDSGLDGALHVAADCWLLAHGGDLVRTETLSGAAAPIGVTPLLLMAFPVWLLYRAGADAVVPASDGKVARSAVAWLIGGYLAVGAGVVVYTSYGPVRSDALAAALHLPVVAALAAGAGAWAERGRPRIPLPGRLSRVTAAVTVPLREVVAVLRSAAAGVCVLVAGGAALTVVTLALHPGAAGASFTRLSEALSGRLAVLAVAVALIPNAAVWGAAYALGPGFALGTEAVVRPAGVVGEPVLPDFPLLAALPQAGPGTSLTWAALVVPVLAGVAVGWLAVDRREPCGLGRTAAHAALGGLACGIAMALLTGFAAGPLGTGALEEFGPSWWLVGGMAAGWTATAGTPTALLVRWVRVRRASAGTGSGWAEAPEAESPRTETPRTETPKAETPKAEASESEGRATADAAPSEA
ncbi:cell division protein PerM [Actinacidiphila glaucinigra]|uniref:cell division protein PerM n=1 Tax=Actinacidiphila glaucinigra TaxID=235986 RepID=UPI003D938091